jgi:hypothetical protein
MSVAGTAAAAGAGAAGEAGETKEVVILSSSPATSSLLASAKSAMILKQ